MTPNRLGYFKARHDAMRLKVIETLGGKCVRCGFSDNRALQLNHINGGGRKEHTERDTRSAYIDILDGKDRPDIELLCANCNWIHRYENGLNPYSRKARTGV